jgi:hypothetical protein
MDTLFLTTARKALEMAFNGNEAIRGLALEITLKRGLAMISWVRLGSDRVTTVAGMTISS